MPRIRYNVMDFLSSLLSSFLGEDAATAVTPLIKKFTESGFSLSALTPADFAPLVRLLPSLLSAMKSAPSASAPSPLGTTLESGNDQAENPPALFDPSVLGDDELFDVLNAYLEEID